MNTQIRVQKIDAPLGAVVTDVDLTAEVDQQTMQDIRRAWLEHHVLVFPDQPMTDDDQERFTLAMGGFGDDPYIRPIPGREHIAAICRRADEKAPVFAENWHSDWSFQVTPPAGTCLFGITIPPIGGDTGFINQHKALEEMPDEMRRRLEGLTAIHSAQSGYAPRGMFGDGDREADRSMDIVVSDDAYETHNHPLVRAHNETGRPGLFSTFGYIIGIEGMPEEESRQLLTELYAWQSRPEFQYQHKWQKNMLVMWDNRSVLHKASGGYDGYDRLLHRTTIADNPDFYLQ
jgi:taurine dioxygenase